MPGAKLERGDVSDQPPKLEHLLITPASFGMVGELLQAIHIPVESGMPPGRTFRKGPIRDSFIIVPSNQQSREDVPFRIIIENRRTPSDETTWRLEALGRYGCSPENEPEKAFDILVGGYSEGDVDKKGFEGMIHLDRNTHNLDIGLNLDDLDKKVITAGRYQIVGLHFDSQSHRVFFIGRDLS